MRSIWRPSGARRCLSCRRPPGGGSRWGATGLTRLFNDSYGGQASWLLPAALVLLAAGLVMTATRPRTDRTLSGGTLNTYGSDDLFSSFTYLDGTSGRLGYYGYYNHRQGEGFRDANSEFDLDAFHLKLMLDATTDSRWILTLAGYEEEHGEPGGLTFATGPGRRRFGGRTLAC